MNDEIKEILEEIKSYTKHEYLPPCCELTPKDCQILLDYITNLQQEKEILKRDIEALKKYYNELFQIILQGEDNDNGNYN